MSQLQLQKVEEDQLACPICLEIPEENIYQCRAGHSFCQVCSNQLLKCPNCGVPFTGAERIRNLALEGVIGGMEIACKHQEAGCTVKMLRRELPAHLKSCKFRPLRICKHFGHKTCNFESYKPSELFEHLVGARKLKRVNSKKCFRSPLKPFLDHFNSKSRSKMFKGMLFGMEVEPGCVILEIINYHVEQQEELSICYVHFGDSADPCPFSFKLEIKTPAAKDLSLSWTDVPVHVRDLEECLASPPFKISKTYLRKIMMDNQEARLEVEFMPRESPTNNTPVSCIVS